MLDRERGIMRIRQRVFLGAVCVLALACSTPEAPEVRNEVSPMPPEADKRPVELQLHGDVRVDNYYWLRERDDSEVIAYLEAENEYTEAVMAPAADLQGQLYDEIVGRIKQDDDSVPYKKGDYLYYHRFEEGGEYPVYCRKRGSLEGEEEIMLDASRLAEGHEFFTMWGFKVSPDAETLAYAVDTVGRRFNTLRFRDLESGEDLPDVIENVTYNGAWANDSRTYFYTKQDPVTLRWSRVFRHVLGTDPARDVLVFEEQDEEFATSVSKTKSERYLVIGSRQTLATEMRVLDADNLERGLVLIEPRQVDHEYRVDHAGDQFYITTNWNAPNFRLMTAPETAPSRDNWTEMVPHRDDVFFVDAELFDDYLVIKERTDGLLRLRIKPRDGGEEHPLDFGEPAYDAWTTDNHELDTTTLRYAYTSLTTPKSVYDYDMKRRQKTLLKEEEVVGDFDKADYTTERLWATARDGVLVPVSLVYRTDLFAKDGSNPCLLYGYGSYGSSMDASFSSPRLSLLDRGFVYAIAHIRGGQELGRQWYEDGKLLHKKNTFTDFIDSARFLVVERYTSHDRLFAMGGSAGGLLMGAVTNMAPELFKGIVNHVGWVDVVTTMLDEDVPLTTAEYDEWGDPREKAYYDYMLSYSPYDNIEARDYPNILMTTGLHDSQVQYWEPAKYVAKMRTLKTDDNILILKTNMEAGHGGATGRMKQHRETALDYAFILTLAGIEE
jgi:oligopeptidase B